MRNNNNWKIKYKKDGKIHYRYIVETFLTIISCFFFHNALRKQTDDVDTYVVACQSYVRTIRDCVLLLYSIIDV